MILVFKTAVEWKVIARKAGQIYTTRFPGQWVVISCAVSTSDEATLWFRKSPESEEELQVIADKKIRLVSKNIYNITRLTDKDKGYYICRICGIQKEIFIEMLKGKLTL
jgi:hypothetical protein